MLLYNCSEEAMSKSISADSSDLIWASKGNKSGKPKTLIKIKPVDILQNISMIAPVKPSAGSSGKEIYVII